MRDDITMPDGVFPFYTFFPKSELVKAVEEDGKWIVYLMASSESLDQDNESTAMSALKKAADDYLAYGHIQYDHQATLLKDPTYIIGEPLDVKFNADNETLVKGMLYKKNKIAQGLWNNVQSGSSKFGSSIGGYILKKSKEDGKQVIKQVIWRDTSITPKPVNNDTMGKIQLTPFAAFAKALGSIEAMGISAPIFKTFNELLNIGGNPMEIDPTLLSVINSGFLKKVQNGGIRTQDDVRYFIQGYRLIDAVQDQIADFLIAQITAQAAPVPVVEPAV